MVGDLPELRVGETAFPGRRPEALAERKFQVLGEVVDGANAAAQRLRIIHHEVNAAGVVVVVGVVDEVAVDEGERHARHVHANQQRHVVQHRLEEDAVQRVLVERGARLEERADVVVLAGGAQVRQAVRCRRVHGACRIYGGGGA